MSFLRPLVWRFALSLLVISLVITSLSAEEADDPSRIVPALFGVEEADLPEFEDFDVDEGGGVFGEGFGGSVESPDDETWKQERIDAAREFVKTTDVEAALDRDPYLLYSLPETIGALRNAGDEEDALRLSGIYLKYYPMSPDTGSFYLDLKDEENSRRIFTWADSFHLDWARIAMPYYAKQPAETPAARQTMASMDAFEKFRDLCCIREPDIDAVRTAAQKFIEDYPKSHFCPAVVVNACRVARGPSVFGGTSQPKPILDVCADFAHRLQRAGASDEAQLIVQAVYASELGMGTRDEQKLRRSIFLRRKLADADTNPHRAIELLFRATHKMDDLPERVARKMKREIYQKIMDRFPGHSRRSDARYLYVETFIGAEGLPRAIEEVRAMEEAGEEHLGPELYAVASGHVQAKEFALAKTLCNEIITRFPDGAATGAAYVALAHMHQRDGDEERTVAAYRQAAMAKSFDTNYGVMDASNTKNEAHEFLGEYYMKQEDWKEALHWWETWEPHSWCGNCAWSMRSHRKEMMEACRKKLAAQKSP